MKIAYLIIAHGQPKLLQRLIGRLPSDSPIFVHISSAVATKSFEDLRLAATVHRSVTFVPRYNCSWGSPNLARATISLIKAATSSKQSFDYATLLSGVDYPIKSNAEIANFLENNIGREFIESFPLEAPNRWSESHGTKWKAPERALRYHFRIGKHVIRTYFTRKLPYELLAHGGSQWWTLTSGALNYIIEFWDKHPRFDRFLNGVHLADEFAIQTVLSSSSLLSKKISTDDLRFITWDRAEPPWPAVYRHSDFETIQISTKHFARKMDAISDSSGLLDLIDQKLLDIDIDVAPVSQKRID